MADDESLIDCISHYWEAWCFEHSANTHGEVFLLYAYRREGAATLLLDLDIVYKGRGGYFATVWFGLLHMRPRF